MVNCKSSRWKKEKVKLVPRRGQKSALIEVPHKEEPYGDTQTESCTERFLTYITVLLVQYLNIINIGSRRLHYPGDYIIQEM